MGLDPAFEPARRQAAGSWLTCRTAVGFYGNHDRVA
jgi:hypothetical protein